MAGAWTVESQPARQLPAALLAVAAGLALATGFRDMASRPRACGFALGLLLLAIGGWVLLAEGATVVTVDPARGEVRILRRRLGMSWTKVLRFDDIVDARLMLFTLRRYNPVRYYVLLQLRGGRRQPLFFGFFEGSADHGVMQQYRDRLWAEVQARRTR